MCTFFPLSYKALSAIEIYAMWFLNRICSHNTIKTHIKAHSFILSVNLFDRSEIRRNYSHCSCLNSLKSNDMSTIQTVLCIFFSSLYFELMFASLKSKRRFKWKWSSILVRLNMNSNTFWTFSIVKNMLRYSLLFGRISVCWQCQVDTKDSIPNGSKNPFYLQITYACINALFQSIYLSIHFDICIYWFQFHIPFSMNSFRCFIFDLLHMVVGLAPSQCTMPMSMNLFK